MERQCVHSCRGVCAALDVAEHREREAIKEYQRFAAECDYPDVRELLDDLIRDRNRSLAALRVRREALLARFNTLDNINDSFA
jgi:rubrerythrin